MYFSILIVTYSDKKLQYNLIFLLSYGTIPISKVFFAVLKQQFVHYKYNTVYFLEREVKKVEQYMVWLWVCVIVFSVIAEILTSVQLTSIWLAVGGVVSVILALCGVDIFWQIVVFFAVSFISLALTRPLAKRLTRFEKTATNADMFIGKNGKVLTELKGRDVVGRVKVMGDVWSAVADDDLVIPADTEVVVKAIEGVKLVVEPKA